MTASFHPVMDIVPWPHGQGFSGQDAWWSYVHDRTETERLELLVTAALINPTVCQALLSHNSELINAFHFSERTRLLLAEIKAATLEEFAQRLIQANQDGNPIRDK